MDISKAMNISNLKIGESAIILDIASLNTSYKEALSSLGINEGSKVTCVRKSILGKLLHIKCNNSTVVIRKMEANTIKIKKT